MNEEIIRRLNVVLGALNNVNVCGKPNLANLSGSIAMLEELRDIVKNTEVPDQLAET